jgi:hypothetical protein
MSPDCSVLVQQEPDLFISLWVTEIVGFSFPLLPLRNRSRSTIHTHVVATGQLDSRGGLDGLMALKSMICEGVALEPLARRLDTKVEIEAGWSRVV